MVHLLYGADSLSLLRELVALKSRFLKKTPALNVEELAGDGELDDASLRARLQELLQSQGLFGNERFLVLRNFLSGISKFPLTEEFLFENLAALPESMKVVFLQIEDCDARLRLFKKLKKLGHTKEFSIPQGDALLSWIKNRLKEEGFSMSGAALKRFVESLNGSHDLWQVESELGKLMLLRFAEKTIEEKDVQEVVRPNIPEDVFQLTNLAAEGQIQKAVWLLEQMVAATQGSEVKTQLIIIVGALASQIRSLLLVKELEGESSGEIAKTLGWKEGRVWINLKLAKKFPEEKLVALLQDLKAIDLRLKTSEEPPKLLLTLFFQKMKV